MTTPASATTGQILVEDLKEWQGESVLASGGDKLGKLDEVFYDSESDLPAFAGVKSGTFGKKLTLVPLVGATVGRGHVRLSLGKDAFKAALSFDPDTELTADDEAAIYGHFGIGYVGLGPGVRRLAKH